MLDAIRLWLHNNVLLPLALWIVEQRDPKRMRRCRVIVIQMALMRGDQSEVDLQAAIRARGLPLSSKRFLQLMAELQPHYVERYEVQLPFGSKRIPYYHLRVAYFDP